jgi:hypothetical protein
MAQIFRCCEYVGMNARVPLRGRTALSRRALAIACLLLIAVPLQSRADPLPQPTGEVILTITGDIEHRNTADGAAFDRAMLEALGTQTLRTSSDWTDGVAEFEGVPARAVMAAVGAKGKTVIASALNDYKVEIPVSDFETYPVLFALKMDGREMTVRDRGPIWIIYPRDDFPELRNERVNARWVWQLSGLTVE